MSIKSDGWIKRMAVKHQMIVPFEEGQVRDGVISYGLSSYGYDIRVADEFKIFTNVNTTIVDPKNFDERSFIDFKGDVCIVPPNSFALAKTVEYFRIPRNVMTVCLGKSSYARCFSGSTRVLLLGGDSESLAEMARTPNVRRWGFGVDTTTGQYKVTELVEPRFIGKESLIRITFDNEQYVDCTPDHEFLRHGGQYTCAEDLVPGDGIVPLYNKNFRGRRAVWIPKLRNWLPAHWLSDLWNIEHEIYAPTCGYHRHHIDLNKSNDNPTNIERRSASSHLKEHNSIYYGEGFSADLHGLLIREALAARMLDSNWIAAVRESNRQKAVSFWSDPKFENARLQRAEAIRESWNNPVRRSRASQRLKDINKHVSSEDRSKRWSEERRHKQAEVMRQVNIKRGRGGNHQVVRKESLNDKQDVFCVTSIDTGNFALEAGVMTRNCGIILNVTPFEPEWEGYATLEISNTTPLPAKIYANEGIAQVLFFESDEICLVSYGDKKGKYQAQMDITLARM